MDEEDKKFLTREANRLKWIRTTGSFDYRDELEYKPQPELPARIGKQSSKLYQALLSLDEKYDKLRAKKIIQRIIDGSGDLVMVDILGYIDARYWPLKVIKNEEAYFSVTDLVTEQGIGTKTIKRRLEILPALGFLRKEWKYPSKESKGGRPGYKYKLRNDIKEKDWQALFRHDIVSKSDVEKDFYSVE